MRVIGFGNRFLGLDRMHEAQLRLRQSRRDQTHLNDRGNVVMRDSAIPQRPE